MKFECPLCGQRLEVATIHGGRAVPCPNCARQIVIPLPGTGPGVDAGQPSVHEGRMSSAQLTAERLRRLSSALTSAAGGARLTIREFLAHRGILADSGFGNEDGGGTPEQGASDETASKYQFERLIAAGGMGAVVDVRDLDLRRDVAMKVVLDPAHTSDTEILRFIEEAQITAQLQHPGVIPIYDLGIDPSGNVFYTMKFVRGTTLWEILRRIGNEDGDTAREYPLSRLLTIFQRVCDAVAFAHSKGVIHRDLKPTNVMVGDFGEVLVMDWGLARISPREQLGEREDPGSVSESGRRIREVIESVRKQRDQDLLATMRGMVLGTPQFMAPEQAWGKVDEVDERSDIYALGGILYAILTLQAPVRGTDIEEVFDKVTKGRIAHPSSYNARSTVRLRRQTDLEPAAQVSLPHLPGLHIPASLSAVAMKALSLQPKSRYQGVGELQADIEAYQNGFATSAEQAGALKQFALFLRRNRRASLAGALMAAVLITVVAVYTVVNISERMRAQSALRALEETAPTFHSLAVELREAGAFRDALRNISYAVSLRPDFAAYHYLKGNILQSLLRIEDARRAYDETLRRSPNFPRARQNRDLCTRVLVRSRGAQGLLPASILELEQAMAAQGRYAEAFAMARRLGDSAEGVRQALETQLADRAVPYRQLRVDTDGTISLNLTNRPISDLSVLNGLPVTDLQIAYTAVTNLAPLRELPLRSLDVRHTPLRSLAGLAGVKLERLAVSTTEISDLSPLRGMPLKYLSVARTAVTNLGPLRGMQLADLRLNLAAIDDLSPLVGMPLHTLSIDHTKVTDISPLAGMPLNSLRAYRCDLRDLSALRGMPLKDLRLSGPRAEDLTPLQGMHSLTNLDWSWADAERIMLRDVRAALRMREFEKVEPAAKQVITDWEGVPPIARAMARRIGRLLGNLPGTRACCGDPSRIPEQAKARKGHHYLVCELPLTWPEARAFCEERGAHLVTIGREGEHRLFEDLIGGGACHMGFVVDSKRKARWITGEKWSWPQGFRSRFHRRGYGIRRSARYWTAVSGSEELPFVIEWDR